jgi:hypothetical protein
LAFLDLLFALFAALIMVNLMLVITRGRTPHKLQDDFVLIEIQWRDEVARAENRGQIQNGTLEGTYRKIHLPPRSKKAGRECWSEIQSPVFKLTERPETGAIYRSVFVISPIGSGRWEFRHPLMAFARSIQISTRRGTSTIPRERAGEPIFIVTESD